MLYIGRRDIESKSGPVRWLLVEGERAVLLT